MTSVPYVVGQWVRGAGFYGRSTQLEEILDGPRNALWLLGTRRVGKTSLLKQLEYLTAGSPGGGQIAGSPGGGQMAGSPVRRTADRGYFPLFWDFQGSDDPQELHLDFADALLDAEERLEELGIDLATVEAENLFVSLGRLRRKLRAQGRKLLLLCDEVEELIELHKKSPALLRKLRRAMQSREDIRSVLASSIRLWDLAEERENTSPFLHGFTPPLYIEALSDGEARSLIRQVHLPPESRPELDDEAVELIRERCDNHPYLIQLVGRRYLETAGSGRLEEALEQVATDRMVSFFFSVDFEMLTETERHVLSTISEQSAASSKSLQLDLQLGSGSLSGCLHRLEHLGYVRRDAAHRYVLANYFFRRWLEELPGFAPAASAAGRRPGTTLPGTPAAGTAADRGADATLTLGVELGELDGRYELLRQIGAGATGVVYKAYDKLLQVKIAIKVLKREYAANEEALERFRQEIVLSRDIGHPNVLRVYHLGQSAGKTFITMRLVEGPTLGEMIAAEAPLPEEQILILGRKLAQALAAAHGRKVLHRDIKPHNILVGEGPEPFLTDFGLARVIGAPGITRGGLFLGTPYYTSPEQADLRPLDERSDLYALGLVLYEMAAGRRPFEAETAQEILEMHRCAAPPDLRELRPELSAQLSGVILRCLEKNPAERYPDAGALLSALGG